MAQEGAHVIGRRFNQLVVLEQRGIDQPCGDRRWLCECDCGTRKEIAGRHLRAGKTKSCGCLSSMVTAARNYKHGLTEHQLYEVWKGAVSRCTDPGSQAWRNYGGRGISICDEWRTDAEAFIHACLAAGWRTGLEIDRIDNEAGYCPGNIRCVPRRVNSWNTRRSNARSLPQCVYAAGDRFRAQISCRNKSVPLGRFDTIEEATSARDAALLALGEP